MKTHQKREYNSQNIPSSISQLLPCPIAQFKLHYQSAIEICATPNAMIFSTHDVNEGVDARVVLLKQIDEGFIFFTHSMSPKIIQVQQSPLVHALFYWEDLDIQVRIKGKVEQVDSHIADNYFQSRDYDNQITSYISPQSKEIEPDYMEQFISQIKDKFSHQVPTPKTWIGLRIIPFSLEFWYGRANRNHLRFLYKKQELNWHLCQLAP